MNSRGLPAPVCLAVNAALVVLAGWLDLRLFDGSGRLVSTVFVLGCLLSVVAVRPRGLPLVMSTTPLVLIVAVTISVPAFTDTRIGTGNFVLAVIRAIVLHFPVMAGATALVLILGAGRLLRYRAARTAAAMKTT